MNWLPIGTITTNSNYVFTPVITGNLFKLKHISESLIKSSLKIVVRQAFEDNGNLVLFDYKLISCKAEQEIILFSLPKGLTNRKLAFKRVDNYLDEAWSIEIESLEIVEEGISLPITISDVTDLQQRLDAIQAELTLKALDLDLDGHTANSSNPHNTTALQVGADPVGSATASVVIHEGTTNHPVATTSAKGMMGAADKSKLNAIAPGATVNSSDSYLLNRVNHQGTQPIETIQSLPAILNTFVDNSTDEQIEGTKTFVNTAIFVNSIFVGIAVNSTGYYLDSKPLNLQIQRNVSATVGDFAYIGNFQIDNGGTVFRISLVVSDPGFSLAKTYVVTTTYQDGDSGWLRLNPQRASIYAYYNDCDIDIRLITNTVYLRLRRAGSTANEGVARIRLEFLGATDTAFAETYDTGNDLGVTGSY